MIRTTLKEAARRAQLGSASRATLREAKDDHYWQEVDIDVHHSETHTAVERAQQYGFSCWPAKQDEDQQQQPQQQQSGGGGGGVGGSAGTPGEEGKQPQGDAAEPIVLYLNGSRSHPVVISCDDRRHRVHSKNVKATEGDVFLYRKQDDKTQVHLTDKGLLMSSRDDRTVRMALVQKPQQQQSDKGSQQGGQQGQQQQKKKLGQDPLHQENQQSQKFLDVTPTITRANNDTVRLMQPDGHGYLDVTGQEVWLGYEKGGAGFAKVLTESGPAENVYGRISGLRTGVAAPGRSYYVTAEEFDRLLRRVEALEQRLAAVDKEG